MRRILLYILIFLGLSVAGCRGGRSYDSRLVAADSLVVSQPDSALRLLRGVGFDSMCSDADRAYFALLLTQAKYKCDETITSTDTIDIAVDYFSDGSDADKRLRSLIYRGASLTDMGEITAAMEAYKQAEAAASPDDYENLGYINLRMASLYQKVYSDGREYIDKYRKALHYYELCGNKHYQIVCTSRLGAVYRLDKMDSAYYFINKSIELAKSENDSAWLFSNYELLAHAYWYDSLYQKQKETALYVFNEGGDYATENCLYDLCLAYSLMNKPDSAEYFLSQCPQDMLSDVGNNVSYLIALYHLEYSKGNFQKAFKHLEICALISDSITATSAGRTLQYVEHNFELQKQELLNEIANKKTITTVCLSITIVIILLLLVVILYQKQKNSKIAYEALLSDLALEREIAERNIKAINNKIKELTKNSELEFAKNNSSLCAIQKAFDIQIKHIFDILSITDIQTSKTTVSKSKINSIIYSKISDEDYNSFMSYANLAYNDIMTTIKTSYPNLNIDELKLITLIICDFPNSYIQLLMGYRNKQYVINKRLGIEKKMGIDISLKDYIEKIKIEKNSCLERH